MALLIVLFQTILAYSAPLALVYRGQGVCAKGCGEAAAQMALMAGFRVRFVGPEGLSPEDWKRARLWIQPGGRVVDQAASMPNHLKRDLVDFVSSGGGYFGICAGGFLAMDEFGWRNRSGQSFSERGLGLMAGEARFYYPLEKTASVVALRDRNRKIHYVYWELGPYFRNPSASSPQTALRWYDNGANERVATLIAPFGLGRVAVTAHHPEAPPIWRDLYGLIDPDGVDYEEAKSLIRWAAGMDPLTWSSE